MDENWELGSFISNQLFCAMFDLDFYKIAIFGYEDWEKYFKKSCSLGACQQNLSEKLLRYRDFFLDFRNCTGILIECFSLSIAPTDHKFQTPWETLTTFSLLFSQIKKTILIAISFVSFIFFDKYIAWSSQGERENITEIWRGNS